MLGPVLRLYPFDFPTAEFIWTYVRTTSLHVLQRSEHGHSTIFKPTLQADRAGASCCTRGLLDRTNE